MDFIEQEPGKKRLLDAALELFRAHGFNRVSVEEITSKIGMSKKTFYKYFATKQDIILQIVDHMIATNFPRFEKIVNDPEIDFIEKQKRIIKNVAQMAQIITKPLIADLQKYLPEIWLEIDKRRTVVIREIFGKLFHEGMQKNYFRKDIDEEMIITMYISVIRAVMNPEFLTNSRYSAAEAFDKIVDLFMKGILSDEARKTII